MSDDFKEDINNIEYADREADINIEADSNIKEAANLEEDARIKEDSYIIEEQNDSSVAKKKVNVVKEIFSWLFVLVSAFVLAYIITNYVIVKAEVTTGSMETTIMTGDKIVGNRIAYLFSKPKRGDIIIFPYPDDETQNYVKRIIGLPGEKVDIVNNSVYINDNPEPLKEDYLKEEMKSADYHFQVPEDCYLVLGDNRNLSKDARVWENKYVSKDKIIGKVWFRYSPKLGFVK